jgi:iron complex outermembrane receptor protein
MAGSQMTLHVRQALRHSATASLSGVLLLGLLVPEANADAVGQPLVAQQATAQPAAAGGSADSTDSSQKSEQGASETTDLGKITVHTRNRLEPLQDVPVSVSVVTGSELERLDAYDITAIVKRVGNLQWNFGNQRTSSLAIRGFGKQGQTEAQDPSVGVVVDGINYAYNALISSYDFTDVDSIELARGPQGTLQGKNATLGILNITTRRPSFTPDAEYSVTVGQLGTVIGRAAGGGPVIDDVLAWRGSLSVERGKGDINNLNDPDDTYTNKDRVAGHLQLLFRPTENFSARFAYNLTPVGRETTNSRTINTPTPGAYANGAPNLLTTDAVTRLGRPWFTQNPGYSYANVYLYGANLNAVDYDYQRGLATGSDGASAELNWTLGDLTLTSITGYEQYHFNAINDDGTPFDIYRNAGGFLNHYRQLSQELRLSAQTGGFVDYQGGLFFFRATNSAEYRRAWGGDAGAWFATPAQYKVLDTAVNADGSVSGGRYLLTNSLNGLSMDFNSPAGLQYIRNKSYAVFAQADWHLTHALTVTTGARATREDRETTADSLITSDGDGGALDPASVNGVALGGFASNASTGALTAGVNSTAQLSVADQVANRYFGIPITSVPGAAYGKLTAAQLAQVAAAKAIRLSQVGVLYYPINAQPFKKTQPAFVVSPSYKFSENETGYLSWQYGEKAGISQVVNGISDLVQPEKNTSYEIGLKSSLLHRTLILNADAYLTTIRNYQQNVRVVDQYTTNLNILNGVQPQIAYTTTTGNVPKVESRGIEVDAIYAGVPNLNIRFSGAYSDAFYKSFPNSAQPVENAYPGAPPYQDVTGQQLAGASKVVANLGLDYRIAVWRGYAIRASSNTAFSSRFNSDISLSSYAWVPSSTITDLQIGFSRLDNKFDVGVLAKNLFNDGTPLARTWNSYNPPVQRWIGVVASGKL